MIKIQKKQNEWSWQWNKLSNDHKWLFKEWIFPNTLEDFRNKTVLDCGCGRGDHLNIIAKYSKNATGIDLNASETSKKINRHNNNVKILQGDISRIKLKKQFDIVYSIGVLHHTDDPTKSFNNISLMARKNGRVIVWVYSKEGNFLNRTFLEFMKNIVVSKLKRKTVLNISIVLAALMYIPIYTIYLLPLRFLPFYEYFQNWRVIGWKQNKLNVFDKLNAPTTHFIDKKTIEKWFNKKDYSKIHISPYKGVSWRASGVKK